MLSLPAVRRSWTASPSSTTALPSTPTPSTPDPTGRRTGAAAIAAGLAAAAHGWLDRVEYRPAGRWTSRLATADAAALLDPSLHPELAAAQVWLLSWLPGQGTPLHDHGSSAGAFAVVDGALTESVVQTGRHGPVRQVTAELTAGRIRHFGSHHVHQVSNGTDDPAVSVHVYAPALEWMNTYRLADGLLVRTGTERAGVDW